MRLPEIHGDRNEELQHYPRSQDHQKALRSFQKWLSMGLYRKVSSQLAHISYKLSISLMNLQDMNHEPGLQLDQHGKDS